MSVFPTVQHIASWCGLSPGNNESAGIQKNSRTTKGNMHIKTALVQAALSASKKKETKISAFY